MIERRTFLFAGIAVGGGVVTLAYQGWRPALGGFWLGSRSVYFLPEGAGAQLLSVVEPLESLDAMGEAWLASLEDTPDLLELMAAFLARLPSTEPALSSAIAAGVRRDFADRALCDVAGWRLSLTECQLAGMRRLAVQAGLIEPGDVAALADTAYTVGEIAPVENWGPRHTLLGKPFNPQLDGHSGMWFKAAGVPAHARVMIDGRIASTSISETAVTSGLRGSEQDRILSSPGRYEIALVDPIRKIKQPIGFFEVRDPNAGKAGQAQAGTSLCEVKKWGPRKTRAGVAANEQPDGSMGLWLHTDCLPRGVQLFFGDDPLVYRRKDSGLTAPVPLALLGAPGRVPLSLVHAGSGEKLVFGHLVIE